MKKRMLINLLLGACLLAIGSLCFGRTETRKIAPIKKAPVKVKPAAVAKVEVKSASVASVNVAPGAKPVTVTLTGSNLNLITSAALVSDNWPIKGTKVTLGAANPTKRNISFYADAQTKPVNDCQLRLTAGKQTINVSAKMLDMKVVASKPINITRAKSTKKPIFTDKVLIKSVSESNPKITLSNDTVSKKLIIIGSNLDLITAAEIVSGNDKVPETTVQLGQQSKGSVEIIMHIFPSAQPGDFQLRLIIPGQSITLPGDTLNITILTFSQALSRQSVRVGTTSITDIPHNHIQLWAGGRAQITILEGTNLDLFESVKVMRHDRPVTDVKAWFATSNDLNPSTTVIEYSSLHWYEQLAGVDGVNKRLLLIKAEANAAQQGYHLQFSIQGGRTINILENVLAIKVTDPLPQNIQIIKPSAEDIFLYNNRYEIQWKAEANTKVFFKLILGNNEHTLVTTSGKTGAYGFGKKSILVHALDYSTDIPSSTQYRIKIEDMHDEIFALSDKITVMESREPPCITSISPPSIDDPHHFGIYEDHDRYSWVIRGADLVPKRVNQLDVIVDYGDFKYCVLTEDQWEGKRWDSNRQWELDQIKFIHPGLLWPRIKWNGRDEINTKVCVIINDKQSNWVECKVKKYPPNETKSVSKSHDAVLGDDGDDVIFWPQIRDAAPTDNWPQFAGQRKAPPTWEWAAPAYAEVERKTDDDKGDVSIVDQPIDPIPNVSPVKVHWWFEPGSDANYWIRFHYRATSGFYENWLWENRQNN